MTQRLMTAGAGLLATVLAVPDTAYAYLDAGTGGLVLQLILGGVAGLLVVVKLYWRRLCAKLGFFARVGKGRGPHTGLGH